MQGATLRDFQDTLHPTMHPWEWGGQGSRYSPRPKGPQLLVGLGPLMHRLLLTLSWPEATADTTS
jgi:hypothetical protein